MAAAERVVPRQPVHQHRRLLTEHWKSLQQHLLVGAEHALGGDYGLGQPGRAGSEKKLGDAVRTSGGKSCFSLGAARLFKQAGKARLAATRDLSTDADQWRIGR
ncbi:hypothetical protein D3C87_1840290 [compost metagenome]